MSVRTVTVRLLADVGGFSSGMNQAERNVDQVGKKLLGVGLLAGAGLGLAVKKSADFEAAMSAAAAATQAQGKAFDALHDAAIRYGAATQYSATEAADAITAMGKAGVSTTDILGGGLKGALDLAAAGQLSVADAGEIAATAMTQFGLSGKDLPHVADLLAAGAGKAQGSVSDLAYALKYVGPVAHSMGLSIEETTGAIAEFSSQGIIGEQAGTALRGLLLSLSAPSDVAAEKMKQLGINIYDTSGQMLPLSAIAQQLQDKLGGLTESQRNQALGQMFSNAQVTAATILYKGGAAAVEEWTKKVNDQGFALEQARKLTDNLKGDVERLGGAFDTALISSGENANGVLREMVQQVTGALDVYNSLPGPVKTAGTAVAGVTSAVGLLGGGLLIAAPRITATRRALGEMGQTGVLLTRALTATKNVLMGPWGVALAGAAIGLGFLANEHAKAVQREQEFKDSLDAATGALTEQSVALRAQQLQQDGTLQAAQRLGLNLQTVTQAATGNASAIGVLQSAYADAQAKALDASHAYLESGGSLNELSGFATQGADSLQGQARAAQTTAVGIGTLLDRLDPMAAKSREAQAAQQQLAQATKGTSDATSDATGATAGNTAALTDEEQAAKDAASAISQLKDRLDAMNGVHLTARAAARKFQEAIDDARSAVKKQGTSMEITTAKGRANQEALDAVAQAANDQAKAILDETGSEAKMRASLRSSRSDLIATARRFGLSKAQAKAYADEVLGIPKKAATTVTTPGLDSARSGVSNLRSDILALPTHREILFRIRTTGGGPTVPGPTTVTTSPFRRAGGGPVSGPGGPTGDKIPAMLSDGEFVVRAAQTAKHRGLLEDINAGARGFAAGGMVGRAPLRLADGGGVTADFSGIIGRIPTSTPSKQDVADLRAKETRATRALANAEDALDKVRHRKGHTAADVARAERAVANARDSARAATRKLGAAEDARAGAAQPFSSRFHTAATADTKQMRGFLRDIAQLRAWGFNNLADQLVTAADEDAMRLAHDAARSKKVARTVNRDVRDSAAQEGRLAAAQGKVTAAADAKAAAASATADFRSFLGSGGAAAKTNSAFLADVQAIAGRGFGDLASQLLALGPEEGADFAKRARKMTDKDLRASNQGFKQQAAQEKAAEQLPARLAIQSAIAGGGNPTLAQLAATTGLSTSDLQAAAISMRAQLGGQPSASRLLAGLNATSSYTATGAAGTAAGDHITVQVQSTGNPYRDGEKALAGARRVRAVSRGRW